MFGRIPMQRVKRSAVALLIAMLAGPAGAGSEPSPRQLIRFGVEAARQGLWREAVSRWERAVKDEPENPRLLNNLAVAYESLGRFEDADREYREARRLAPDNREIRDNHESFLKMHGDMKGAEDAAQPAPPSDHP